MTDVQNDVVLFCCRHLFQLLYAIFVAAVVVVAIIAIYILNEHTYTRGDGTYMHTNAWLSVLP